MKITIKVFENDQEIVDKIFSEGSYRLGRSEFCDIVLSGDSVSRSHVEFRVTEANVYMTNMSLAGRVKLNNERVETAEIKDGDTLTVGIYKVVVFHGERSDKAAESLPAMLEGESPIPPEENVEAANNENNFFNQEAPAENALEANGESSKAATNVLRFPEPNVKVELDGRVDGSLALKEETEVEEKPLVARLIFVEGPRKGEEIPIEAFEIVMGRSRKADIFIDDEKLSRQHSKIVRNGLGYRLMDLSSRNGTYVNGMRVLEHPLTSFDVIELGDSKIKFLILDLGLHDPKVGGALVQPGSQDTRSVMLDLKPEAYNLPSSNFPGPSSGNLSNQNGSQKTNQNRKKLGLLLGLVLLLAVVLLLLPESKDTSGNASPKNKQEIAIPKIETERPVKLPPQLPKEYADLTPDLQRAVEGHYNSAISENSRDRMESALSHLKKIHDLLPYYKNSKDLVDEYEKKLKLKRAELAQADAKEGLAKDLKYYLEDGIQYLREGDFDRAAESFNSAIALDPRNDIAIKGLRGAELRIKNIGDVPPERDEEQEKRDKVKDLFEKSVQAFAEKRYYETIKLAEDIRKVELKGETNYLNEAKQLIDNSKLKIREEFEPFLINAKEKYGEGDYNACRDISEEMIKRDPMFEEAKEILAKAKKQLNRLAKEAYIHGYILESMNRLEEAKQYWTRAKNYVRPGDPYYEKIMKKLDQYQ